VFDDAADPDLDANVTARCSACCRFQGDAEELSVSRIDDVNIAARVD